MRALARLQKKEALNPQKKYNFKVKGDTDFELSTIPQLSGKYIYRALIPFSTYKFFYAPLTSLEMHFLLTTGDIVPVIHNCFIPTDVIKQLIVVRPKDNTSYTVFQCFLSDIQSVKIFDVHTEEDIEILALGIKNIELAFPVYNLKVLIKIGTLPSNWDFIIYTYPFNDYQAYTLDKLDATVETVINNVYTNIMLEGSEGVTNPNYPFPSWWTSIQLTNNDGALSMENVDITIISWGETNK